MALIARIRRATCIHAMDLSPGELSLAMSLVGLDIVARVAPHAPNVTPIAASAVFAGMVLRSRALALAVPISALSLSDLVVGSYDWRIMGVVYAALALPALAARGRARPARLVVGLALLCDHERCSLGVQRHVRARSSRPRPVLPRGAAVSLEYRGRRHALDDAVVRHLVERKIPAGLGAGRCAQRS